MSVLNVTLKKINAERFNTDASSVQVSTNVTITSVEVATLNFGTTKQPAVRFGFDFTVGYQPKVGSIQIVGEVVYVNSKEKVDAIVADWKKNKTQSEEVGVQVVNRILNKSQLESMILAKELGLPLPIQLPKVASGSAASASKKSK